MVELVQDQLLMWYHATLKRALIQTASGVIGKLVSVTLLAARGIKVGHAKDKMEQLIVATTRPMATTLSLAAMVPARANGHHGAC